MRVLASRAVWRWARQQRLPAEAILTAVAEAHAGLVDADLGGGLLKKRVPLRGQGKRGGARLILVISDGATAFVLYGFAKGERANISRQELLALRRLGDELKGYSARVLDDLVMRDVLKTWLPGGKAGS